MTNFNLILNYTLINGNSFHPKVHYSWKAISSQQLNNFELEEEKKQDGINIFKYLKSLTQTKIKEKLDCPNQDNENPKSFTLILEHNLPLDVFIDPYQLESQLEFYSEEYEESKLYPYLLDTTKIELELPVYEVTEQHKNKFYLIWPWNLNENLQVDQETEFTLPIHLRYRKPKQLQKYEEVIINPPDLKLLCYDANSYLKNKRVKTLLQKIDSLSPVPFNLIMTPDYPHFEMTPKDRLKLIHFPSNRDNFTATLTPHSNLPSLTLRAPTGQIELQPIVSAITLISILISVIYLLRSIKISSPKNPLFSPPYSPSNFNEH